MMRPASMPHPPLQLTEVLCALSLATDLANGNPPETTLRICLLAVGLAEEEDLGPDARADVFYTALLRYIGCTAFAPEEAALGFDDLAFKQLYTPLDAGRQARMVGATVVGLAAGQSPLRRARSVAKVLTRPGLPGELARASCEVGQRLAQRLRMAPVVVGALEEIHERWDGKGVPLRKRREAISLPARVVQVALVAEQQLRMGGVAGAVRELKARSGGQLDPSLVKRFLGASPRLAASLQGISAWTAVLQRAPGDPVKLDLATVATAFADFVDLKSAFTFGHSTRVAELARQAGVCLGLPPAELERLHLAGLLHDLGRVGVPTGIWDKPGPLDAAEWDRVQLHAHDTHRILSRSPALHQVAELAAQHHERLDGSGYPRRSPGLQLGPAARVLAAADCYDALLSERPHRGAKSRPEARAQLEAESAAGRLDPRAVRAVLEAAGEAVPRRGAWPAGLTDREVQVLRRLVQGESNKEIARHFGLSARTVQHHAIHIYAKLGVSSRAGAALFALEHRLVGPE